uniref:Uncharacterized protein n=1 Tax=Salix viminalis TaxID=40686 RepID=A0A6N2NFF3_SALVM
MAIKTPRTPQYRTLFYGPTPKILARQKSGDKRDREQDEGEISVQFCTFLQPHHCVFIFRSLSLSLLLIITILRRKGTVSAVVNLFNISLGGERASRRANCCCNERWQRRWVNLL